MYFHNLSLTQTVKHTVSRALETPITSFHLLRTLHKSPSGPEAVNSLTQGHATNPDNLHPQDVQSQSVRAGEKAKRAKTNESIDAANESGRAGEERRPDDIGKGNPEKIGFTEQVGGASATARKFERDNKKK